ncbi:uncharacterized protein Z520_11014 [Fonsecaea multimorphosa CBS 102226]|uniref:Uncharacterized protein n=1 Tax=Fonsecaea multimorphosa CBS 102226 TaxID=1442371 RepID=A0A0D2I856_9EURO|nr:uncharacterized protein Z520_11014 [Fonsecaea multimorphosa CBS 102226]KIX93371.1 hypothetical protein Z520_11014 [Fonsecaea multimorphosa CBS 102226]OAL18607.1 hypothetical protein AYO22_10584 [Fonsecaea multimorphosa]
MAQVESPKSPTLPDTLLSVTALARFEFEPGKGNDGTKVMMVEWQDDDQARDKSGTWQVSWPGKRTVFPAADNPSDNIRRVYFLLPPGAIVPPHITLAYYPPTNPAAPAETSTSEQAPLRMTVNPLPAIFTPELGATAKASGRKGVLHTIWAKKRLQVLEKEIKHEEEHNLEGIALEMARSEKSWIENNFGLAPKPPSLDLSNIPKSLGPTSPGIQSPKSPGGRRLSEKLKGLSIGTSDRELNARGLNTPTRESHPLSPEASDMAYSSFSSFRNGPVSASSATGGKKVVAQAPPDYIRKQQQQSPATASLSSMSQIAKPDDPADDDLFAVALSPRSPDGPKSPFSISSAEVGAFAKIKGER